MNEDDTFRVLTRCSHEEVGIIVKKWFTDLDDTRTTEQVFKDIGWTWDEWQDKMVRVKI